MKQTEHDERWLDVLAGRAQPSDAWTRQAQQYRAYFERRAEFERGEIDDVSYLRTMNDLRARGAFDKQKTSPATGHRTSQPRWAVLVEWLRRPGWSGGRAALAMAVLAAVLLPLALEQQEDTSWGTVKSLPPAVPDEVVLLAAEPIQQAHQIQAALLAHGVASQVAGQGGHLVLTANVVPDLREAARTALAPVGVTVPPDGRLRIVIRPH